MDLFTPTLLALRLSDDPEMPEGDSLPLKIECAHIEDLTTRTVHVVKFASRATRGKVGIISEIVAGHLAAYFEIPTPDFALVEISAAFAQSANENEPYYDDRILTSINRNQHPFNFGSQLIRYNTFNPLGMLTLNYGDLDQAEMIFAFDSLIHNADRTLDNPNIFMQENQFIIYDHDKGFCFLIDGNDDHDPLRFCTPSGRSILFHHLFYGRLKKREVEFDKFVRLLIALDDTMIKQIVNQIPYGLRNPYSVEIDAIVNHLITCRENIRDFRI